MNKKIRLLLLAFFILPAGILLVACGHRSIAHPVIEPVVTGISINNDENTLKTDYFVGDTLDINGLKIIVKWDDGSTTNEDITTSNFIDNYSTLDFSKPCEQTVDVRYGMSFASYIINVRENVITNFRLKKGLANYIYNIGDTIEDLDLSGLIFEVTDSKELVSEVYGYEEGFNIVHFDAMEAGDTEVTIEYKGQTGFIPVTVIPIKRGTYSFDNLVFGSYGISSGDDAFGIIKVLLREIITPVLRDILGNEEKQEVRDLIFDILLGMADSNEVVSDAVRLIGLIYEKTEDDVYLPNEYATEEEWRDFNVSALNWACSEASLLLDTLFDIVLNNSEFDSFLFTMLLGSDSLLDTINGIFGLLSKFELGIRGENLVLNLESVKDALEELLKDEGEIAGILAGLGGDFPFININNFDIQKIIDDAGRFDIRSIIDGLIVVAGFDPSILPTWLTFYLLAGDDGMFLGIGIDFDAFGLDEIIDIVEEILSVDLRTTNIGINFAHDAAPNAKEISKVVQIQKDYVVVTRGGIQFIEKIDQNWISDGFLTYPGAESIPVTIWETYVFGDIRLDGESVLSEDLLNIILDILDGILDSENMELIDQEFVDTVYSLLTAIEFRANGERFVTLLNNVLEIVQEEGYFGEIGDMIWVSVYYDEWEDVIYFWMEKGYMIFEVLFVKKVA